MLWEILWEMLWEMLWEILWEMAGGMMQFFHLTCELKDDILFTKHPRASMCNSYTFSICFQSLHFDPLLFKFPLLAHYCLKSSFWPIIAGSLRVSLFIDLGFP